MIGVFPGSACRNDLAMSEDIYGKLSSPHGCIFFSLTTYDYPHYPGANEHLPSLPSPASLILYIPGVFPRTSSVRIKFIKAYLFHFLNHSL